jgi:opacity protein-like surface antigen
VRRSLAIAATLAVATLPEAAGAQAYTRQGYVEPSPRTVELTAQGGLFWSTQVNGSTGKVVFDVAPTAAAVLDLQVDGRSQVEIVYLFARPQARFQSTNLAYASSPPFPVTTQYLQLGGLTTFDQGTLEPFLAGGLGLAWFHPSSVGVDGAITIQPQDAWLFAFHLGGGARWWITEAFGLRFQARFLMPVLFSSGTFLSGPNGAALQVNAGIPIVQGDLTIGLAFSL